MNLKEFQSAVTVLIKEYDKFRNEFDKTKEPNLKKFEDGIEELRQKQEKLKKEIVNPVKSGALKEVTYHTEQIMMQLKKINDGIDNTDEVDYHLQTLKGLFNKYEEAKKELQKLQDDLDNMEEDINDEKKKPKLATVEIRSMIRSLMKNAKSNMASST